MKVFAVSTALLSLASCGPEQKVQDSVAVGAAFECGKQNNDVEVTNCLDRQVQKSSKRVEIAFQRNLKEAAAQDNELSEFEGESSTLDRHIHVKAVRSSQAAWEKYAEAQCRLESYVALGGSAEHHFNLRCWDRLNLQRLKDLRSPLILESQRLQPVPEE